MSLAQEIADYAFGYDCIEIDVLALQKALDEDIANGGVPPTCDVFVFEDVPGLGLGAEPEVLRTLVLRTLHRVSSMKT